MKIGCISSIRKGQYITKNEAVEGPYPVILGGKEPAYFINKFNHTGQAIVISRSGASAGYVSKWNEPIFITDGFLIEPNEKTTFDYLYYALKNSQYLLHGLQGGAAIPHVTPKIINAIDVYLPTLSIQRKIASILSTYDNLIENNTKRIKLLEQMSENLYKEWFVRFRFPGHENVEMENGIPKGWNKVTLDEVLSKITTGLNPRKNFVLGQGENYYVTIKNMGNNNIYLDDNCDKVDDEAIRKINRRSDLKTGDILFSGIGTIGRVYLISIPTDNWNVSESVFTLRANEKVSKEFLYMLLLSDKIQNYCHQHAQGVAQPGIRMAELKACRFALPTWDIIELFTTIVSDILSNIDKLRKSNQLLTHQRDLLLPRLMSGKLEVKP